MEQPLRRNSLPASNAKADPLRQFASGPTSPSKSKNNAPLSPLEQIVADTRPIRGDGHDKFFGYHNPSNTCYANSVLQCLYFSPAFRQHVIDFPNTTTTQSDDSNHNIAELDTNDDTPVTALPLSPTQDGAKASLTNGHAVPPKQTQRQTQSGPPNPITAAADSKETFDNRKKAIMASGPHVRMQTANFDDYGMPESLFTSLKDMYEAIISQQARMGVIVPTRLIEVLRENHVYFRQPIHHDAHEFLNLLLNDILESVDAYTKKLAANGQSLQAGSPAPIKALVTPRTQSSWVHELFEGVLANETRCLTCENVSQRDEIFLDLSVDLEDHTSVTSCLSRFSEEEMLCERNKFHCERCSSLQEAEKRMKIKKLPRILALHLKRFKWFEQGLKKVFDKVTYPFYLRIQNTTTDAEDPDRLYELYAVIIHLGSTPHHGHYVSIIKTRERGWLLFDDELVLPVDARYVQKYFGGEARNSACAYVLFYQETTDEAIVHEQDVQDIYKQEIVPMKIEMPTSPIEGKMPMLERLQTTLKTPTTERVMKLPAKTPTSEDEDFMAHLENPTTPRPLSGHLNRLSLEAPTAAGTDLSAQPSERASMDKLSSATTAVASNPPEKPIEKTTTKHKMFGSGSMSRLRNTSLSLKSKPRLFSKHERTDSVKETNETAVTDAGATEESIKERPPSAEEQKPMKHKASRFGLGRKKSGNLL